MKSALPYGSRTRAAFTLIELLVVISIISLLISILMPSLTRAREQAKRVHCLAKLKDMGTALATYENNNHDALPPAEFVATDSDDNSFVQTFGWIEILFTHIYRERVNVAADFPVQRNIEGRKWEKYFLCKTAGEEGVSSGHYRVYLPVWATGSYSILGDGTYGVDTQANPFYSTRRERIRPKMPLIGDANEFSERGDGLGNDDCSYIDAGEANISGSNGRNGNRFSDRHDGGTNFLFQDLHASWELKLREDLARDWDLNDVDDIEVVP